ncbi:TetR/AcrR family transcriptional regulator [Rhizobium sp. SL86]|uniref:TetR/AcrR family transcriptional regulator n=1 Tax=Rhizobium sp. SL86 TaxID=2995148 RepID=UPI0022766D05|nr:TetR/AcrR family transcriptional regulator [Rhizobium sp. SL86]MCY1668755.1 TetR/AcrR family transcriptional regulator [Rhizobium sp. SL86]
MTYLGAGNLEVPAMPKPGRPLKEQSEDLTDRMVAVATRLFLEKGYAGTTIDELARRLGSAKRSVYSRFTDKADLFRLVTTTYAEQSLRQLGPVVVDERPLSEQLQSVCLDTLRLFLEPDVIAIERVVVAEAVRFPEIVPILESARLSAMERFYPVLLRLGCGPTEAATRDQAQILWDLVVAAPVRAAALGLWPRSELAMEQFVAQRVTLFLGGLPTLQKTDSGVERLNFEHAARKD